MARGQVSRGRGKGKEAGAQGRVAEVPLFTLAWASMWGVRPAESVPEAGGFYTVNCPE